ncbi:hypothetical protein B0H13DRAFT_1890508 [Mycena leptocephala]|nr:hypothetical protein B0H13DRAFT_1890508 [Mycena leptocephala]
MTLDNRIQEAICSGVQVSQPRFDFYLRTFGLGERIKKSNLAERGRYHLAGELAMHMCFVRYLLDDEGSQHIDTNAYSMLKTRILSPETYAQLLEKAKPRLCQHSSSFLAYCVLVFLGALSANFSFDEVLLVLTIVGSEKDSDICERHLLEEVAHTPKRARRNNGEAKPMYLQIVIEIFAELEGDDDSGPLKAVPQETMAVTSSSSIFLKNHILDSKQQEFAHTGPAIYFHNKSWRIHPKRISAFKRTAFPHGNSVFSKIPVAFYDGFMSALTVDAQYLSSASSTSRAQPVWSGDLVEPHRLSYRRARAPSPPSPRPRLQYAAPQTLIPSTSYNVLPALRSTTNYRSTFYGPILRSNSNVEASKRTVAGTFSTSPGAFFSPALRHLRPDRFYGHPSLT